MRASGYDRVVSDWYCEPRWIVDALLDVEPIEGLAWDPACGSGNIPKAMEARDITSLGSDIADRGYGIQQDFFTAGRRARNIVSNPPYGVIERFINHALTQVDHKVCILARLALLEGIKRQRLFHRTPLARVYVSSRRVSMPPGGTDIKAKGGSIAYAWFVWERGHYAPPTLGWL